MVWLRLAFFLLLLPFIALGVMWAMWGRNLPAVTTLDALEYSGAARIYDRQGRLITTLTPPGGRKGGQLRVLTLRQMGPWAAKAVMESEDRRFYEHGGVDFIGITRGLLKGIFQQDLEGGSSITQQVVKNTLLSDLNAARTVERKFKEALLAIKLEHQFSKDEILQVYMNVVYWGDGGANDITGIDEAAQAYFRKSAEQLNLAESAYLATIIPAPNKRYKDFIGYRPLVKNVLNHMVEDGKITQSQADTAWQTPISPAGWQIRWGTGGQVLSARLSDPGALARNAPHANSGEGYYFWQALSQELSGEVSAQQLYRGSKVYSTYDQRAQRAAERASLDANRIPRGATLGIALLDPQSGAVRALVGQKLYAGQSPPEWNNALQAKRQVGSSIKPLLYTLALSRGWKQSDTVLDAPIDDPHYQPKNYDGTYLGAPVTLRYALDHSLNLPTVRLGQAVGIQNFEAKLRELGLQPAADQGLSLAIGTLEASPLQMAAAYAPFANGGVYHAPHLVERVESEENKVIYQQQSAGKQVWDAQTAWLGLDMIRGVVDDLDGEQGGLATRARIDGWQVGGKTGTTNDVKDLWFVGTTSQLTGAVWVGKQAGGPLPQWAYSGTVPTPIWKEAVEGALSGLNPVSFREPSGIEYAVVRRVKMAFRAQNTPPSEPEPKRGWSWWPFSRERTEPRGEAAPPADPTLPQVAPTSTPEATPSEQGKGSAEAPRSGDSVILSPISPSGDVQFEGNEGQVEVAPPSR